MAPRYLPALCVLLVFPLVPTLIHTYAGALASDGRTIAGVLEPSLGYTVQKTTREATWGVQNFAATEWDERRYRSPEDDLVVTVARSYDWKKLYHHPELACAYGTPFDRYTVERFPQRGQIPVHVLRRSTSRVTALYALQYDDGFVEDPLRFQLRLAGALMFSARKPMTLFFVHDPDIGDTTNVGEAKAVSLLFDTIDRFMRLAPGNGSR